MTKKVNSKKSTLDKKSKILYSAAVIVILIPLLLLGYIYLSTKENAGVPTVGNRFSDELDPAITDGQLDQVRETLKYDQAQFVEVNLKSATLRITIDLADNANNDQVTSVLEDAYDKVTKILPEDTYFTNKEGVKMYDLEISAYNFIPEDDNTNGWVYKSKLKNAANEKSHVDVLSSPKNEEVSDTIEKDQSKIK